MEVQSSQGRGEGVWGAGGVCAWVLFTVSCFGHSKEDMLKFKSCCRRDYGPPLLVERSAGYRLRMITGHKRRTNNTSDACVACSKYVKLTWAWVQLIWVVFWVVLLSKDNISALQCVTCLNSLSVAQIIYRYGSGLSDRRDQRWAKIKMSWQQQLSLCHHSLS